MLAEDLVELTIDGTPLLVDQTGEELQVEEWQEETTGDRRNNGASAHVWDGKGMCCILQTPLRHHSYTCSTTSP